MFCRHILSEMVTKMQVFSLDLCYKGSNVLFLKREKNMIDNKVLEKLSLPTGMLPLHTD